MEITYIGHSGFLVELSDYYFLFDYFEGELPTLDANKPLLLFASHFHQDHFNPEIFKKLEKQKLVYGIFSKDIFESRTPENMKKWFVAPEQSYEPLPEIKVETLRSTDKGVAFLVKTEEALLYHAGDLNDWVWEGQTEQERRSMTGRYQKEIKKLNGRKIDVAFIPLDVRQKKDYDRGILYFLENTETKKVIPMHFWKQPEIIEYFLKEHPEWKKQILAMKKPLEKVSL